MMDETRGEPERKKIKSRTTKIQNTGPDSRGEIVRRVQRERGS
jgi:hypothetical protein